MQQLNYLTELLGFQGFYVSGIEIDNEGDIEKVIITLGREGRYICSGCGREVSSIHSSFEQEVRHLHLWRYLTILRFKKVKLRCRSCGVKVERLEFLEKNKRVTKELTHQVSELCKVMSVEDVATFEHLHWQTVKEMDKKAIQKAQSERSLEGITVLGVDEISVGRGHNYLHLVSSLDGPKGSEVLYVGEGRKEEDLKPFWRWFGKDRAKKITHGVMDMARGFINSFRANCPSIKIIYDKFHVMRHLLNALNEVRKAEFKRAGKKMRGQLMGKKFILLKRMDNLKGKARKALKELLSVNRRIYKAHLLKESFGQLWSYKYKGAARRFWDNWKKQLKWQRLEPYKKFAKMIDNHIDGILGYCDKKVSLGYIEGTNLKAKNIIRRAYGYRDKEYMKLKIIQGCSSIGVFRPYPYPLHHNPG
ncbi:ISL3 family transposase [Thermospira aquatica]|uniref:ISL3 family transposase n=1 Tax=Thermospira aquatica TaxID=2828656 RepID=A0AAX3BBP4_9SPIR|nr:ISL3 family transposase [Thermospira aquatica]URA09650.1 ISL3 family transposase [Thermospira aquatica]